MSNPQLRIAGDHKRKLSRRVRLNQSVVEAAKCPPSEPRIAIYDTECPRLVLLVTSGSKSFYAYAKAAGRPIRYRLGGVDDLTVADARKACMKALAYPGGLLALAAEKKAKREANTVGDLFDAYFEHRAKRKRTANRDRDNFRRWCSSIAGKPLDRIDTQTIASLHARIGDRKIKPVVKDPEAGSVHTKDRNPGGPYAANRTLAMLSAMFRWGVAHGRCPSNPCAGVERFDEVKRERFIQPDELPRLIAAIQALDNPQMRDFFWLCLLTGARRSNVAAMRWQDVDLHNRLWRIPASAAKAGKMMVVPLDDAAMSILKARAEVKLDLAWVFPSYSITGHLINPTKVWSDVRKAAGLDDVRMHDLRRTLGSYMAIGGASSTIIGAALGQSSQQATAVYARLTVAPIRQAVESATKAIIDLANAKPEGGEPPKTD